jgi:hypothetical protein
VIDKSGGLCGAGWVSWSVGRWGCEPDLVVLSNIEVAF